MVSIHKDIRNWTEQTVSFQRSHTVIGLRISALKTYLIVKWAKRNNKLRAEMQKIKHESRLFLSTARRTKKGELYKNEIPKYEAIRAKLIPLREAYRKEQQKYWRLSDRENMMSQEPIATLMFNFWLDGHRW